MDLRAVRDELLEAALPHVAFDGWSWRTMREAAKDAGYDATVAERVFPGGAVEVVEHFCDYADRLMISALASHDLGRRRFRERVALAVRLRLEPWAADREAVRRAVGLLALPQNAAAGLRCTYRTVDAIWYALGDTATDFSFYTKRATLAAVYSATVLYWLEDMSDGSAETWEFLDRRIEDVMRLPRLRSQLAERLGRLPNPFRLFAPPRRGGAARATPRPPAS